VDEGTDADAATITVPLKEDGAGAVAGGCQRGSQSSCATATDENIARAPLGDSHRSTA